MAERLRTVDEVAAEFGLTPHRMHRAIRKHHIPVLRDGRWVRFDEIAIAALHEALIVPAPAPRRKTDHAPVLSLPGGAAYAKALARTTVPKKPKRDRLGRPMGFVYFIQGAGHAIKIGYAKDPEKRLRGLQTGHPSPLVILGTIPGSMREERLLKRKFTALRLIGEWHRPEAELLDFIAEHAKHG